MHLPCCWEEADQVRHNSPEILFELCLAVSSWYPVVELFLVVASHVTHPLMAQGTRQRVIIRTKLCAPTTCKKLHGGVVVVLVSLHTGLSDVRLLGKSRGCSGAKGEFQSFQYQLENYLGLIDANMLEDAEITSRLDATIVTSTLSDETTIRTRTLDYILLQLMSGSAATLGDELRSW